MFLALKEMKHNKLKFGLIVFMVVLISYLIFVLTALAYGLAQSNRSAIDSWQASSIVLSDDANSNLMLSSISGDQVDAISDTDADLAILGQLPVTVSPAATGSDADDTTSGEAKTSAQLLGIDAGQFIYSGLKITDGRKALTDTDAIVDTGLANEGYKLGDTLQIGQDGPELTIVGFVEHSKLSVSPVIYTTLGTWHEFKYGETNAVAVADSGAEPAASAVVVKHGAKLDVPEGLEQVKIGSFIEKLPGYAAQNLTFSFMLVFLFVITLIIIAVFLYILTMQKIPSFAVLKVQGILTRYLVGNTIGQAAVITASGIAIGAVLTAITAIAVPAKVPMVFNLPMLVAAGGALLVMSILGSLVSVRTIAKIDPVSVIGSN